MWNELQPKTWRLSLIITQIIFTKLCFQFSFPIFQPCIQNNTKFINWPEQNSLNKMKDASVIVRKDEGQDSDLSGRNLTNRTGLSNDNWIHQRPKMELTRRVDRRSSSPYEDERWGLGRDRICSAFKAHFISGGVPIFISISFHFLGFSCPF